LNGSFCFLNFNFLVNKVLLPTCLMYSGCWSSWSFLDSRRKSA